MRTDRARERLSLVADLIQIGQGVGAVLGGVGLVIGYALQLPPLVTVGLALVLFGIGVVLVFGILSLRRTSLTRTRPQPVGESDDASLLHDAIERKIDDLHIDARRARLPLVLGLADPPDDTTEPHLEWPHLAARNASDARLQAVHADLLITSRDGQAGTVVRLRWDPDDSDLIVLEPGETRTLSLCLRSREPGTQFNTSRRGILIPLDQWVCYLTHEGFLLNGDASLRLPPGVSDLRLRVTHGDGAQQDAWFRAYVPHVRAKPIWVVALPDRELEGGRE